MRSRKRIERIKKLSRLLEGGFDGSIGSEFHSNILSDSTTGEKSIFDELKDRHSKDIKLKSYLPYDSEGIDEDIHIYILDKKFFGPNIKERNAAISAITYLFNTKSVDFNISNQKIDGIRNSNPVNKKSEVLTRLKEIINQNISLSQSIISNQIKRTLDPEYKAINPEKKEELFFDDHKPKLLEEFEVSNNLFLSESQIYYLEHLEKSIEKSEIPFMLYIYDPNAPEEVSVNAVKHDAMHILKDVIDLDKQVARVKYPSPRTLNTSEKQGVHPLGHLYKYIYTSSRYFGQALVKIISDYSSTQIKDIPIEIENVKRVKTKHAEDALSMFMKFLYSKIKNYKNFNLFLSENWTTDNNHDILQSLIFSDLDKSERVIDYSLPDANSFILELEDKYGFKINPKYTVDKFYKRVEKVFESFVKKLVNIRRQYLEKTYKLKIKGYEPGYDLFKEYQGFIDSMDSKAKESDGEVRRRMRFMSGGKDSIYAFIRISV